MACSAMALLMTGTSTLAQDGANTDNQTVLEKIVVKGDRLRQEKLKGTVADTPLASQTTHATIARKDIQTLNDLGNTTEPGVSYVARTKSVNIRGLEADRILTTIDGIAIPYLDDNVRDADGGVNAYDFTSLATVDIVRGADSSRAGSGALGGSVVLRTLEPEDLIKPGQNWGGFFKSAFDGSDNSVLNSVAVAKRFQDGSILFQGSYKAGHETQTAGSRDVSGSTRTVADPAVYDNSNLLFKLRRDLEGGHQIGLTAERYSTAKETDMKSAYTSNYTKYNSLADTTRTRFSLDYKYAADSDDALISNAWASLYYQKLARSEGYDAYRSTTAPLGRYSRVSDTDEDAFGVIGAVTGEYDAGALKHEITVGADVSYFTVHHGGRFLHLPDRCLRLLP